MIKRHRNRPASGIWHAGLALVIPALFSASAWSQTPSADLSEEDLELSFQAAILDAQIAEPDEIVTDLFAITPYNPALIRRDYGDFDQILVLSWMSQSKLEDTFPGTALEEMAAGLDGAAPMGRDLWVTAAPQVQQACRAWGLTGDALELRLKQYLGLNAAWSYHGLVSIWVSPDNLYRPCPDPEINDSACTLADTPEGTFGTELESTFVDWFTQMESISYGPNGAPWTRLGYTYDWGDPETDIGASEYLVAQGAPVTLAAISPLDVYCTDP